MNEDRPSLVWGRHPCHRFVRNFTPWTPASCRCFTEPAVVENGAYQVPRAPGASSDVHDFVGEYSERGLFDTEAHAHTQ